MSARVLLDRAWIVVLSTVVVAGVAFGAHRLHPSRYTAEAVLLVPPKSASGGPGNADQAAGLAATYVRLIPKSADIAEAVAARLRMPLSAVVGRITAHRRPGTALLSMTFHAETAALAARGSRAVAEAVAAGSPGVPRGSVTVIGAAPTVHTVSARNNPPLYAATARAVVAAGGGSSGLGDATQANDLATTLAGVIPSDEATLTAIAGRLGSSPAAVRRNLKVFHDDQTSLLRVRFDGATSRDALAGARAVADSVTDGTRADGAIASGSLVLVRFPKTTTQSGSSSAFLPVGIGLGLALGVLLAFARERVDPRLRDAQTAAAAARTPATDAARVRAATAAVLLDRWAQIGKATAPPNGQVNVALLAVTSRAVPATRQVAQTLSHAGRDVPAARPAAPPNGAWAGVRASDGRAGTASVSVADDSPVATEPAVLDGAPGPVRLSALSDEARLFDAAAIARQDVIVLVADRRTRVHDIRRTVEMLAEIGMRPDWALLAGTKDKHDDTEEVTDAPIR